IVKEEDGYDMCCSQKKWANIARKMNFHDTQTSRVLKQHYEKLLLSYDVYETGIYEEQTDISTQIDLKKGHNSKTGRFIIKKIYLKKKFEMDLFFVVVVFNYLVESNGTMKNGNKRKDISPPSITNNVDPVRK
ncbi:unnamed protein product, partial [Rotaria sp. Silwood1]